MASPESIGLRLDALPLSGFHRRMLWLIAAGMFFDSFDITLAGSVLGALVHSGLSNLQLNGYFISATFVGMAIGGTLAGLLGDRFGRRFTYQANLLVFGLASVAAGFASSMPWLIALRLVMGIGLGAEIVVGYSTLIEVIPPQQRGRYSALLALVTNSALFVSSLAGYFLIPLWGWRSMFFVSGAGALLVRVARKSMPESPRWLAGEGRLDEAEQIVRRIEEEIYGKGYRAPEQPHALAETPPTPPLSVLFSREVWTRTLVGSTISVVIGIAIYSFVTWVPTFLLKQGLSLSSSLGYSMVMSLGGPVGAGIGVLCIDRFGRRRCITIASLLGAAMGVSYALSSSPMMAAVMGFLLFCCLYAIVALAVACYIPELFGTRFRLRGNGFCAVLGRIASFCAPGITLLVYQTGGIRYVAFSVAMLLVLQALIVFSFGIETRSRSLEVIEEQPNLLEPAVAQLSRR
ncbi:MFS transporter [Paraburkholderia panacisoli]|uniref:MFS transporter n=1 Tax=Paraburkholderia panacisoli TaxID=2603818 RepID=A0A5B0G734_9BURK|nr:MFS transporter [Paraburkholderia panacisoli]KAA0999353.1 MFS transporter [Paraburkholderia panacisoli]